MQILHGLRMELQTGPLDVDLIATAVVFERDMERLVHITHPMPQEFECGELVRGQSPGACKRLHILLNRGHDAGSAERTGVLRNPCGGAWQVDEMLARTLAW